MAKNHTPTTKLDGLTVGLLIILALFFDLLSVVPVLNIITNLLAWFAFGLIFWLLGIGFNIRKLTAPVISFIVEFVPVLSALPTITLAIVTTVLMVKSEERLGVELPRPKPKIKK